MFTKSLIIGLVTIEVAGAVYTLNKIGLLDKAKNQMKKRVNDFNDMVQDTKTEFSNGLNDENVVHAEVL